MRSLFTNKLWVILLAVLALGALAGLASGLGNVPFHDGQAFGQSEAQAPDSLPKEINGSDLPGSLPTQLGVALLLVLGVVMIGLLLSPETRKKFFRMAMRAAAIYLVFYILYTRYPEVLAQIGFGLSMPDGPASAPNDTEPFPEFTPPPAASPASYLVSFGIAVLLVVMAWKLYSVWKDINPPASPMQKLAAIARNSLRDLSSGRDSTDVIMNCYYRMSDVISEKQNISRRASMTPNEFASQLEQAGLPAEAVRRLTRLFEAVRYGGHKSDSASVNEAVICLTAILQHCGEAV